QPRQPADDLPRVVQPARHDQVPHQHTAQGQAVLVHLQVADLAVHLRNDFAGHLRVVDRGQVLAAGLLVPQLEVRHVRVHQTFQDLEPVQAVVGTRVVDQRQAQAAGDGVRQSLDDLRGDVLGGDEVDVVAAHLLEAEHHAGQALRVQLP